MILGNGCQLFTFSVIISSSDHYLDPVMMKIIFMVVILSLLRCDNGTESIGCGPQEEFRACADLAIHSSRGKCHRTNSSNGYMCQRRNWLIHKADFVLCTVSQFCNAIQMMQPTLPKAGGKILFQIESKLTQSNLNQMLDTHTVQLYIWQKEPYKSGQSGRYL